MSAERQSIQSSMREWWLWLRNEGFFFIISAMVRHEIRSVKMSKNAWMGHCSGIVSTAHAKLLNIGIQSPRRIRETEEIIATLNVPIPSLALHSSKCNISRSKYSLSCMHFTIQCFRECETRIRMARKHTTCKPITNGLRFGRRIEWLMPIWFRAHSSGGPMQMNIWTIQFYRTGSCHPKQCIEISRESSTRLLTINDHSHWCAASNVAIWHGRNDAKRRTEN